MTGPSETPTALITGASSGIGAELAAVLAERGVTVGIVARREDRLAAVLEQCRRHAPGSQMWVADLAAADTAAQVADAAWEAFGHVDVLVNNAAIPGVGHVSTLGPDDIQMVMQVNFHAPVRLTLALLPRMLERGAGTIANVSSLGGRLGIVGEAAYCSSKFALTGWTESLALDLYRTPIRVKHIVPGAVDTEIWDHPETESSGYEVEKVPARDVAVAIADALDEPGFEHYIPESFSPIALFKAQHIDDYLAAAIDALG